MAGRRASQQLGKAGVEVCDDELLGRTTYVLAYLYRSALRASAIALKANPHPMGTHRPDKIKRSPDDPVCRLDLGTSVRKTVDLVWG